MIYIYISADYFQVPVKPGMTLKDALAKRMKVRELIPETCVVYRNETK